MGRTNDILQMLVKDKRTPSVLTITSCIGVVATAALAVQATPLATRRLDAIREKAAEEGGTDKITLTERVKYTWKLYVPAVGVGVFTVMTIITSQKVNERNAALLSASALVATNTLREYQQNVLELVGSEKESKLRDRIAKRRISEAKELPANSEVFLIRGGEEVTFYDSLSGRYFKAENLEALRGIENKLNREILSANCVSLNDLYYELDLPNIDLGDIVGFTTDNMIDFHFSPQLSPSNKPVVVLSHINIPVPNFNRYGETVY